jgi:hypothetical protein
MLRVSLCYIALFFTIPVSAQSYRKAYKDVVADRVIVNNADETITAITKPIKKSVEPNPEKNYYWFSAHQIRVTQGGYDGKLLNGPYTSVYLNKNLKEKGEFKKGLKTGEWNTWSQNGTLKEIINWKAGLRTGKFFQYDEAGNLKTSGRYKKGEYDGSILTYISKDSIQTNNYKAGKLIIEPQNNSQSPTKDSRVKTILKKLLPKNKKVSNK